MSSANSASICLSGTIQKLIRALDPDKPDKVQIVVRGADDLYREIRVDNIFQNEEGDLVNLAPGDEVEITVTSIPRVVNIDPETI